MRFHNKQNDGLPIPSSSGPDAPTFLHQLAAGYGFVTREIKVFARRHQNFFDCRCGSDQKALALGEARR